MTSHCTAVSERCRSAWIVEAEIETIVKSIITIATAGTSGQNTRKRNESRVHRSPYRQAAAKF